MARIEVPIETISRSGLDPDAAGTVDTDTGLKFQNDGRTFILIKNTRAGAMVVTVTTPQTVAGLAVAELTKTLSNQDDRTLMGPFPTETFNQQSGADAGMVYIDADGADTDMDAHVYRL